MKIIACGNEITAAVITPMYMDKRTRSQAAARVLEKLLPQDELNKRIDAQILIMYSHNPESRVSFGAAVLENLEPGLAKKIDAADLEKLVDIEILRAHSAPTEIRQAAGSIVVSDFIDSMGKEEYARQVDEDILNFVLSKDIPVYIDTSSWPDERIKALCDKLGFQSIPLMPRDQADTLVTNGDIEGYAEVEYKIVDDADLQKVHNGDREYRAAWCFCPKKGIKYNMECARTIRMQQLKKLRNARLDAIDHEINIAEDSDAPDIKAIKEMRKKRRALRDMPQTLNTSAAKTPDDLRKISPAELS
jgi:hypothetical protein